MRMAKGFLISAFVLLLGMGTPAGATLLVEDIQFNLMAGFTYGFDGGDAFYKDGDVYPDGEFFVYDSHVPGFTGGYLKLVGASGFDYDIKDGTFDLRPSELLSDESSSTHAKGKFGIGALLVMTGEIWKDGSELFSGTILSATVTGDLEGNEHFYAGEQAGYTPDYIGAQMVLSDFGGELATGAETGLVLAEDSIVADITLGDCSQDGNPNGDVEDFQSDIYYALGGTTNVQMYTIPEPVSFVLIGLGGLLAMRRKR